MISGCKGLKHILLNKLIFIIINYKIKKCNSESVILFLFNKLRLYVNYILIANATSI